jgi:hypothetical protein
VTPLQRGRHRPSATSPNAASIVDSNPNANGKDAFSFTASRRRSYLPHFNSYRPGAYHFKVVVKHRH